jgi:hypothetical protein
MIKKIIKIIFLPIIIVVSILQAMLDKPFAFNIGYDNFKIGVFWLTLLLLIIR